MTHFSLAGVKIDNFTMQEAINKIEGMIKEEKSSYIVTPNAAHIVLLQKDEEFRKAYESASLVLADGMPLIWVSKFLGVPLKQKISGSDLLPKLCEVAAEKGFRVFLLGGRSGAALKSAEALKKNYSTLQIVGIYSPPFGFEKDKTENDKITKMIISSKTDILFIGLGAPKQEKWIYTHYKELNIPVSIGVGVTFEFIAGIVKRAPKWMQKIGLEWFFRLLQEPKRLWKRYLIGNTIFILLVLKELFKKAMETLSKRCLQRRT